MTYHLTINMETHELRQPSLAMATGAANYLLSTLNGKVRTNVVRLLDAEGKPVAIGSRFDRQGWTWQTIRGSK